MGDDEPHRVSGGALYQGAEHPSVRFGQFVRVVNEHERRLSCAETRPFRALSGEATQVGEQVAE
ncbi:hypothetical protein [Streptomyces sp. NPDC057580]|uniref:hypothetical protein n=1 Tax=Streptomyces sp. NPDC057580 TaxID=3346173 RepID=UPI0036CB17C1